MAKILLVDDDRAIVRVLQVCLANEGHTLSAAYDGEEALRQAREERPDLLILDVKMPHLDGFRVLHRIKSDPDLRQILVVMLTAKDDPEDLALGLDIGADCYLTKPVHPRELLLLVRRLLERKHGVPGEPALPCPV